GDRRKQNKPDNPKSIHQPNHLGNFQVPLLGISISPFTIGKARQGGGRLMGKAGGGIFGMANGDFLEILDTVG
ncbi:MULTISPECIES: hypothetical protein, partial [unclassified Azospirillum]|uniref:hypothetical protein n=1 Tax=unclassified Azospirillum TaxID=2630922 RepID=UPI0013581DE4